MKANYQTLSQKGNSWREGYHRGIKDALEGIVNAVGLVLLDKYGMDRDTTAEIMQQMDKTFIEITEERIKLEDVKKTLKDEYDLVFQVE